LRNVGNTWEDNIQAYFEVTYLKIVPAVHTI